MCCVCPTLVQSDPPCPRPRPWVPPWRRGRPRAWTCGAWALVTSRASRRRRTILRSTLTVRTNAAGGEPVAADCGPDPSVCPPHPQRASPASLAGRKPCREPWTGRPRTPRSLAATPTVHVINFQPLAKRMESPLLENVYQAVLFWEKKNSWLFSIWTLWVYEIYLKKQPPSIWLL